MLSFVHLFAAITASIILAHPLATTKLKHIIIIMQENRSFDSYFGTYPGANGIPMHNGHPTICNPNPITHQCVYSYHDTSDLNYGGPHDSPAERADVDGGKMDGFVAEAVRFNPTQENVMGYHTDQEIPNYWTYAENYVLNDEMFAPSTSFSTIQHLYLVSEWAALCSTLNDPKSCVDGYPEFTYQAGSFAWTDITYLLHRAGVSWKYYVFTGNSPDVINPGDDDGIHGIYVQQNAITASDWNPLPDFTDVIRGHQLGNIVDGTNFYNDAANGTLPSVCWVIPTLGNSEHPPQSVHQGMEYVTGLVNAVMQSPDWSSSAIFIAWDDWGGMFDHVNPPTIDWTGYGIRVPSLVISPWALHNVVDHHVLSFDAYNKLIEDLFLNGQRLDPKTDNRWDPRPDVRENYPGLGDLLDDFNFTQPPQRPIVLPNASIVR